MPCIPRWKRQVGVTPVERPHPTSLRSATFPKGEGCGHEVCLRWKRQARVLQRARPHPASLRSATFPKGEGCGHEVCLRWERQIESTLQNRAGVPARFRKRTGHDLIRPRCARPPSPKGKTVATKSACDGNGRLAHCRGHDLIRPRCARPPSPKGKAVAKKSACVGNGRLAQSAKFQRTPSRSPSPSHRNYPSPVRPHPPRCGRTFFHLLHQIFLDSHPLPSL